ncbi:MAG: guanylate kinase [Lachnospiraceae bacterium]|nr:guanylate kinase [Lachnospiraceae bacterium]MBR1524708.1 guanylate kinase [Lachnospiraceae bacterium]
MKFIFYITGKSASGKDSVYKALLEDKALQLSPIILYTTRPMRDGEKEGKEYHFADEDTYQTLARNGEVIECRTYNTIRGPWRYFTVSSALDDNREYYLGIGTLESYLKIRDHFGKDRMVPIYIKVEDGERLKRAIDREIASGKPDYKEMCRRYIADDEDFSEEKLLDAGVEGRFRFENKNLAACTEAIRSMIIGYQGK